MAGVTVPMPTPTRPWASASQARSGAAADASAPRPSAAIPPSNTSFRPKRSARLPAKVAPSSPPSELATRPTASSPGCRLQALARAGMIRLSSASSSASEVCPSPQIASRRQWKGRRRSSGRAPPQADETAA